MTDHANKLRRYADKVGRPSGDVPAVMCAAAAHIEDLERRLREAEARVAEIEAERAERETQKPAAWAHMDSRGKLVAHLSEPADDGWMEDGDTCVPLYAAPPVTAPVVGYVNALRYIAWTAAGYMDCVHIAKQAIGETGALPPPPKIQPAKTTPHAARGLVYLSGNAGAWRLLVPPAAAAMLPEMQPGRAVLTVWVPTGKTLELPLEICV